MKKSIGIIEYNDKRFQITSFIASEQPNYICVGEKELLDYVKQTFFPESSAKSINNEAAEVCEKPQKQKLNMDHVEV